MRYWWDLNKADTNFRDHRVRFEDAITALEDPNRLEDADTRQDYGEDRDIAIGMAQGKLLHVTFITNEDNDEPACRIISAREAERHEANRCYTRSD